MEDNDASKMFSFSQHNCSYCLIHSIPIYMKVPLESKSQIFISFSLIVHAGRNEISYEIKFWIIAFIWAIIYSVYSIWARGPCPQGTRKEPDFFYYHNSGMPNSMRPFPVHPLCFWWCTYSCYSLHSVKSLCIIRSVSSGLKLWIHLHTVAKMKLVTLESAYLNYAKKSSCRLLCINALLIRHIIFSTVSTVIKNLVRN